jgi:predicted enzyme related to lactoylglutathione lyase
MVKTLSLNLLAFRHRRPRFSRIALKTQQVCRLAALFGIAHIVVSCASALPNVPPLGESGVLLPGKVVWHDLVTPDIETAKEFYGNLFGWVFEDLSSGYVLASHNERHIAGIAKLDLPNKTSNWLPLLSVADMDRTLTEATTAGGKTVLKPFDLSNRGRVAVLKDPQDAAFGIVQSSEGDPADREPEVNGWLWNEIWTEDVPSAITFYEIVGKYRMAEKTFGDVRYCYMESNGKPRIGLIEKPSPEMGNTWVAYIRVADVKSTVEKAKALGGKVLMEPQESIRHGSVAVLTDPNGAGFVVQEWVKY